MNELTESNRPKNRLRLKRWLYVFAIIVIASIAVYTYLYYQVRDDILPPFNEAKAKQLSLEKRRQYDVLLFNQLVVRGEMPSEPRYQLFRKMADDGFEVAYLTLELFDIRYSDLPQKYPRGMDRLKDLAKQGDASAQCLYGLYGGLFEAEAENEKAHKEYINASAKQGHPACSASYGLMFTNSKKEEIEWIKKSAEAGDMIAQLTLADTYARGIDLSPNFSLARCWANEAVIQSKTVYAKSNTQNILWLEEKAKRQGVKVDIKLYKPGVNCLENEEK